MPAPLADGKAPMPQAGPGGSVPEGDLGGKLEQRMQARLAEHFGSASSPEAELDGV